MTVTVVLADDEPVSRAGLRDLLSNVPWLACIGEASNGLEAVALIDRLTPDLVVLDIQMPGLLGTDVLQGCVHRPHVIFTTAYSEHAVTAFELGALDYVLKPFGAARLESALNRARLALGEPGASGAEHTMDRLGDALSKGPMRRLFVRSGPSLIAVDVDTVLWFESSGDYVVAHTATSRHVVHVALSRVEARLDPAQFLRIHRTHIVHLRHVRRFRTIAKGQLVAELLDGRVLAVSRTRATELRRLAE